MAARAKLKKLNRQVIVLTGATSGIGLATARLAAKRGARLVLVARNEDALRKLADELTAHGAQAVAVSADVTQEEDLRKVVNAAQEHFGGFDTWINNAAVSMYGRLMDVPIEDERQLFETNYWGVVNGSRLAVEHLRHRGGALINIGSTNSDFAAPLQGTYSASKHAVKGYTDALRMELETQHIPVSVTLVKPSPIDTPYPRHARNHLETEPELTPPVYSPDVAAETILFCAENPRRDVYIGGGGNLFATIGRFAPALADRLVSRMSASMQKSGKRARRKHADSLYTAGEDMQEHGDYPGHVMHSSAYTSASLHPRISGALLVAAGVAAGFIWHARRKGYGRAEMRRQARKLAKQGKKAWHAVPGMQASLTEKVEDRAHDIAQALPKMGRSVKRGAERNLRM